MKYSPSPHEFMKQREKQCLADPNVLTRVELNSLLKCCLGKKSIAASAILATLYTGRDCSQWLDGSLDITTEHLFDEPRDCGYVTVRDGLVWPELELVPQELLQHTVKQHIFPIPAEVAKVLASSRHNENSIRLAKRGITDLLSSAGVSPQRGITENRIKQYIRHAGSSVGMQMTEIDIFALSEIKKAHSETHYCLHSFDQLVSIQKRFVQYLQHGQQIGTA